MVNKSKDMTLEEKKSKLIEMIREIPDESPIHKELYEIFKEATQTGKIDEKTISECVASGVNSAVQNSIRDIDEED